MEVNHWQEITISIHSLVKRETSWCQLDLHQNENFNPLPRKEGDSHFKKSFPVWYHNFNPLPRKEGDHIMQRKRLQTCQISIHSLVKRETPTSPEQVQRHANFNPLPRKEGDAFRGVLCFSGTEFQSTPS